MTNNKDSKSNNWRIILILLLLIIAPLFSIWWWNRLDAQVETWLGEWELSYYYENEPQLLYLGTLSLQFQDSLIASLEMVPPRSTRQEKMKLQDLVLNKKAGILTGSVLHDQYKIRGGHLRESFQWKLGADGEFSGKGQCLDFCAEGTQDAGIVWQANRKNNIE